MNVRAVGSLDARALKLPIAIVATVSPPGTVKRAHPRVMRSVHRAGAVLMSRRGEETLRSFAYLSTRTYAGLARPGRTVSSWGG